MKEFVARVGEFGSMEKLRINMIQHSCICYNDLTDIFLEDLSKDINEHIDYQHGFIDSVSAKSTSQIKAMHEELRCAKLKEKITKDVKKELDLSVQQGLENLELCFQEWIVQLESLMEDTKKFQTDQLWKELNAKDNILDKSLDDNTIWKIFKHSFTKQCYERITKTTV